MRLLRVHHDIQKHSDAGAAGRSERAAASRHSVARLRCRASARTGCRTAITFCSTAFTLTLRRASRRGSSKDQQVPDDLGGSIGLPVEWSALRAAIVWEGTCDAEGAREVAEDALQRVVQLVSHTGDELASGPPAFPTASKPAAQLLSLGFQFGLSGVMSRGDDDGADPLPIPVQRSVTVIMNGPFSTGSNISQ